MDTHPRILYLRGHEPSRHPPEPGEASAPGGSPLEGGQAVSPRSHDRRCLPQFGGTLAAIVPKQWQERIAREAIARPNTASEPAPEGTLGPTAPARALGSRIYDQPLDAAAHRGGDSSRVQHQLYHTECLETDAGHRLELPKAQQTRSGAKRKSHSVLEAARVASHKKKPQHLEPTWASLTRVGSCSSRPFPAHGHRGEKPRSFSQRAIGQRSRPSPCSPSHPNAGGWDCIVDSTRIRTFALNKLSSSWRIFCVISGVMWSFSGTVDYHIGPDVSVAS